VCTEAHGAQRHGAVSWHMRTSLILLWAHSLSADDEAAPAMAAAAAAVADSVAAAVMTAVAAAVAATKALASFAPLPMGHLAE
jgi:hypothetical protein